MALPTTGTCTSVRVPSLRMISRRLTEGKLDDAVDTQKKAVAGAPAAPDLRLTLAKLMIQAGDRAKAKAELNKLALMGPAYPQQAEVRQLLQTLGPALPGR